MPVLIAVRERVRRCRRDLFVRFSDLNSRLEVVPDSSKVMEVAESVNSSVAVDLQAASSDTRGKHRILAELKRLEQEMRFLEEELEEMEKTEKVSIACQELVMRIAATPDPLLPETVGPANPLWDRWFEGPQESQGCKCWIL